MTPHPITCIQIFNSSFDWRWKHFRLRKPVYALRVVSIFDRPLGLRACRERYSPALRDVREPGERCLQPYCG